MHRTLLAALTLSVFLFPASVWAQNACDLNQSGTVDVVDVQLSINMRLGVLLCRAGVCDNNLVQQMVNAALNGPCVLHTVSLSWTASTSSNVTGYHIYRATTSGGPYTKVNSTLLTGLTYTDTVQAGHTYYYVATTVNNNGESAYSNQAQAVVPVP
jgi:hypothetical protein